MKITSVKLSASSSNEIELSFRDPQGLNPYNVKDATGLDAGDILPQYYGDPGVLGGGIGQKYYSMSLVQRDIVFKIGLNPDFENNLGYSDLRDELYKLIYATRTGKITIQMLNGFKIVAQTTAFVTKFETVHTDSSPDVTLTLSCDDPVLRAPDPIEMAVAGLDMDKLVINDYTSTAPHGFQFTAMVADDAGLSNFYITDPNTVDWIFNVDIAADLYTNDIICFNSDVGRYLYILRDGNPIHISDCITPGSIWPMIFPGENNLQIYPSGYLTLTGLTYTPAYWGV